MGRTFLIVLALLVLGAIAFLWRGGRVPDPVPEPARPSAVASSHPPSVSTLAAVPVSTRNDAPVASVDETRTSFDAGSGACTLRGAVRCKVTRRPLAAWLDLDSRRFISDSVSGEFYLDAADLADAELGVEAPGFAAMEVHLDPAAPGEMDRDLGWIELEPRNALDVEVRDGTLPRSAASVIAVVPSAGGVWTQVALGDTGADGRMRVALGAPTYLFAMFEGRASSLLATGPTDREAVLELQPAACELALEDGGREGDRFLLTVLRPGVGVEFAREWTAGGWSPDVVPAEVYAIRAASPFLSIDSCSPGTFQRSTAGDRWSIDLAAPGRVQVGTTRIPELRVQIVEGEDGVPLAAAKLWLQADFGSGWMTVGSTGDLIDSEGGWFQPPFLARVLPQPDAQYRLSAWAPGCGVVSRDLEPAVEGTAWRSGQFPLELRLPVGGYGIRLRVLDTHGERFRHRVRVLVDGIAGPVHDGPADSEDIHVPRPESGVIRVETSPFAHGFKKSLEPTNLPAAGEGPIELAIPTGSLRCKSFGSGEPVRWICADVDGNGYSGWLEGQDWVFRGLPEGDYLVGPEWVSRVVGMAGAQDVPIEWTTVVAGRETRVDSTAALPGRRIQGAIRTRGIDPNEVWVRPVFGPVSMPISVGLSECLIRVGEDGEYEVPPLAQGLPSRLLAFTFDDQGDEVPLAAFAPGTEVAIECGTLQVDIEGLPEGQEFLVLWAPEFVGGRTVAQLRSTGHVGTTLTLPHVPKRTRRVQLMSEGIFDIVDVQIEPGSVTSVRRCY